jgi:hypothetical protein
MVYQLCLPLTEVGYAHTRKGPPRSIPPVVEELFALDDQSPSGLVWRIKSGVAYPGKPAGTQQAKYWTVSVKGHGVYYAHRIVYYLRTRQDPANMIVRHTDEGLVLGWQDDNGRDEKNRYEGLTGATVNGKKTKYLLMHDNEVYNIRSLCRKLGVSYSTVYQRMYRCGMSAEEAFAREGVTGVIALF